VLYLISATPKFCPECGHPFTYDRYGREDFFARASQLCPDCGTHFVYEDEKTLCDVTEKSGSDLSNYYQP
jgi:hypothetical protein